MNKPWQPAPINPVKLGALSVSNIQPEGGEDYEDQELLLGQLESIDTRKSRFLDSKIAVQTAVEWVGTEAIFRNCEIAIGRVGSLELVGSAMNSVLISGTRANFASLANSKLQDVVIRDCRFDTLDLVALQAKRVRFENCTVEELDLRQLVADDLDLRGLDFARVRGVAWLKNCVINEFQLTQVAADLAELAFIQVR